MSEETSGFYQFLQRGDKFSHEPLRYRVAALLREAIFEGSLPPGTSLVEQAIAEDLEISRAPVREAIRTLSEEGLVESVPYKGTRVYRLTESDVTGVYSMRGLLEGFAVRQMLSKPVLEPLAVLRSACDEMQLCAEADDLKGLSAADELFHRSIIEHAGHALLLEMWTLIGIRARHIMGLRNAQLEAPFQVVANHVEMVEALEDNDLELALKLVDAHVESGAQLILDDWNDSE